MKDAHYIFADWLMLMARWIAASADRDRLVKRIDTDRRAGRLSTRQTLAELKGVQQRMDALEVKLKEAQALREGFANGGSSEPVHG